MKPRAYLSYDPKCPHRCIEGWCYSAGGGLAVERCSCVKIVEVKPKKVKRQGTDRKAASAGE